jgi:hypothetical protein
MGLIRAIRNIFKGLDKDTNFKMVNQQNYLDALDVTDVDRNTENQDLAIQPNLNMKYAFDTRSVATQAKKYRVKFAYETTVNSIDFILRHRYKTWNTNISCANGIDGNDTLTNIISEFTLWESTNSVFGWDFTITDVGTTATEVIFDIEFPFLGLDDYTLELFYYQTSTVLYDSICVPLQDAISVDKVGLLRPIAFAQCDDKLFVWSTTGFKEEEELKTLTDLYEVPGMTIDYGISVNISEGLNGDEEINLVYENNVNQVLYGNFLITGLSFPNSYLLKNISSPPITAINVSSGVKYIKGKRYSRTVSCIGVAEKNVVTGVWTYTELLRSTNLNFRTHKQIEASVIKANDGYIFRWTDDLNPMRCLYYRGDFVENGFLNIYNSQNTYNLDTINDTSRLILSNNTAKVSLGTSLDINNISRKIKGVKPEGNYQAFVRFLTYDDQYSVFSPASNISTIYKDSTATPQSLIRSGAVKGTQEGIQSHNSDIVSNSALIVKVTGIRPELYKQMQVAIVQTVEDSWLFYALPNQDINNEESIEVIDTGNNPRGYIQLDSTLLNELSFNIKAAQNITVFDGYTIASNVELSPRYDLTAWAQSLVVSATTRTINYSSSTSNITESVYDQFSNFGKYTWLQYASDEYMSYSPFETVRVGVKIWFKTGGAPSVYWIDDTTINNSAGLTSFALASSGQKNLRQFHLKVSNINLDYILPDGTVLRDIVEHIKIVRAEIPKEVLFVGFAMPASNAGSQNFPSGNTFVTTPTASSTNNQLAFVISPDLEVTGEQIPAGNDTKLYLYPVNVNYRVNGTVGAGDQITEVRGDDSATTAPIYSQIWTTSNYANAVDYISFYSSSSVTSATTTISSGQSYRPMFSIRPYSSNAPSNLPFTNAGQAILFYVKPITGDKFLSVYSTQFFDVTHDDININTVNTSTEVKVFSGDFFPQIQYYLARVVSTAAPPFNAIIGFPCLNRYNQQLRSGLFPGKTASQYLQTTFADMDTGSGDPYIVSNCFLPNRPFQNQVADNFNNPYYPSQSTGIYWSLKSLQTALFGSNRIFKFANNKVLEQTYGDITGLVPLLGITSQGVLLCLQERRVSLQYFDNTANLISDSGSLLIGSGKVMERRGTDLTNYGCSDKWSIIKGISKSGKETAYWFCSWANCFMRFGDDGTSNISESALVDAFLNIRAKYTILKNNKAPANGWGCHGVWDALNNRAIWTFRLTVKYTEWNQYDTYSTGQYVSYNNEVWGYENFPVLYKAKENVSEGIAPDDTDYWEVQPTGYNSPVFSCFTIVYSEDSNTFKTFFTHLPMIYGLLNNALVSPSPRDVNTVYEHNVGEHEALYYPLNSSTSISWTTVPPSRINGTNIASVIPFLLDLNNNYIIPENTKVVVTINGKNYSVVSRINNNAIAVEQIDSDDILPSASGTIFTYYVVNCQDPYIEPIINEYIPKYFSFSGIEVQSDDNLKRIEYEAFTDSLTEPYTESYTNKGEFEYFQGRGMAQIKQDTKNNPTDNTASNQFVEGQVMKTKLKFRWGKRNKLNNFVVNMVEQNKRFQ